MKRFAIGCLSVVGILAVVGGALLYLYVLRPVQNVARGAEQLQRISVLNGEVRERSSFVPPGDDLLTQAQVERFMAVQTGVRERLEGKFGGLQAKYEEIEAQGRDPNLRELAGAYTDLFDLVLAAKEAQVAELNERRFSLSEYRWVKAHVLRAAGLPTTGLDLTEFADPSAALVEVSGRVPEHDVELLEPYREGLEEGLSLAFFGL